MTDRYRAAPVAALLALGLVSGAHAQSGMPPLPEGTPATIEGYDTASMYKKFHDWMRDRAKKAVELRAWSAASGTSLFFDSAYVEFEWEQSTFHRYEGSITLNCDTGDRTALLGVSRAMLSDEEAEAQCAWQLNIVDSAGAETIAESWLGANFDAEAAGAFLSSKAVPKGKLTYRTIDWSGFRDPAVFSAASTLRVRAYSARTCPAVTAILERLETVNLGRIDIEYIGEDTDRTKGDWIDDVPYTRVTVKSLNAGQTMDISFAGQDSLSQSVRTDVLSIAENCIQLP